MQPSKELNALFKEAVSAMITADLVEKSGQPALAATERSVERFLSALLSEARRQVAQDAEFR
ncbi:hypothetical protein [Sinorhizobium meliloti]|uniref:hypothetical protein n=1 Tax=Rhizobium meliloti TaxID=382 RepID=UPI000FDAA9BD|nr:hypothetical protein [Sinorhizobium meliloti]RVK37615.1 hypothetical protein CN163_15900 [Sinorhizobium meliloti]